MRRVAFGAGERTERMEICLREHQREGINELTGAAGKRFWQRIFLIIYSLQIVWLELH